MRHRTSPSRSPRQAACRALIAATLPVAAVLPIVAAPSSASAQPADAEGAAADDPVAAAPSAPTPPPPAGQAALERARASWDKGDYDVAEPLYAEAIERGGLSPADVLEAYVHLGSARGVLGKKPGALAAFKAAAVLDLHFIVPSEAGKRVFAIADQARRSQAKLGQPGLRANIPTEVDEGKPAGVDVTLDAAHAAIAGTKLGIYARDPLTGRTHVESVPVATTAHFDLPAGILLPSATLHIRVDWLDTHANRLATSEDQLLVHSLHPTAAPGAAAVIAEGPSTGFWHTAWPYVIGGAALAAGGVGIYFATRSTGNVDITGVRVVQGP